MTAIDFNLAGALRAWKRAVGNAFSITIFNSRVFSNFSLFTQDSARTLRYFVVFSGCAYSRQIGISDTLEL